MKEMIRFIALDVHKDFITVAMADEGRGDVESYGEIVNTPVTVNKLTRKLSPDAHDLCFVYAADCFAFILYLQLTKLRHSCVVAAPSRIPRKPGERAKQILGMH